MIDSCFVKSGFPLSKKFPILCIKEDYTALAVYNRFDLHKALKNNKIKSCYGVWLGKNNTDCFLIDPVEYTKRLPPEHAKNIDSANSIKVITDRDGVFIEVLYRMINDIIRCTDPLLFLYILEMGLPHKTEFNQ